MNDPEVYKFINVLRQRIDNVEYEWEQWKSVASIIPRSDNIWNQGSAEWICLGRLRCSQSVLPLPVENNPIHLGSSSDPFTSLHLNESLHFQDELQVLSDKNQQRVAWHVDSIGCQSWGANATHQRAQFSMVGRGSFTLHDVEVGLQWVRVYFSNEIPQEQRDICLFIRPGDSIELDGVVRIVDSVLEPDRVKLTEPWPTNLWDEWMKDTKYTNTIVRKIRVYPMWARAYLQGSDAKPFWSVTHDGKIYYKCDKIPEVDGEKWKEALFEWDLVINGSVWVGGPLQVDGPISVKSITIEDKKLVKNLNAEFLNGLSAPRSGELLSTSDMQEVTNKKWGDTLDMQGNIISRLGAPRGENDAIPKWYMEQWLLGMRTKPPVRAVTVSELPSDAKWFPDEHAWKSQQNRTLINVDLRKCLDGADLHRGDSILIRCQQDAFTNGIFTIEQEGDGQTNGWIFKRRPDFTPGQSCETKSLRGTYIWCTHGKENARSGWNMITPHDMPAFWWQEGDFPIHFELFQQAGSFSREFGNGLQQIGGKVQLRVNEETFETSGGQLRLRDHSISPNDHLTLDYIDMIPGPGLKIVGHPRIHIGNRCQMELLYNPDHFDLNSDGELCLAVPPMSGFCLDSSKSLRFHYPHITTHPAFFSKSVQWIREIEPPKSFDVVFRCIHGQENTAVQEVDNLWVQYWIACITENGELTSAIPSVIGYETLSIGSGTRWMSKLSWQPVPSIRHYRLWRCTSSHPIGEKLDSQHQTWEELDVEPETLQLLDVIWPTGFQKLSWVKRPFSLPQHNQTQEVFAQIGIDKPTIFTQTPLIVGNKETNAGILHLEGEESEFPGIYVKMNGDSFGAPQISWDVHNYREEWLTHAGKSQLQVGNDIIYQPAGENGRMIIAPEEWNYHASTRELSHERLQVLQGGMRVEGGITNRGTEGYMTEGTGIIGNPALIRTGSPSSHFQRSLGNGVFFSWRGSQLEAIPAMDGKPTGTALPIKQFTITHPTKPDHWLQYACLEGPSADAFIRGSAHPYSREPFVHVQLPEYWEKLVYVESQTVTLTACGGPAVGLWYECEGNRLTIHWEKFTGTKIDYMVVGQRRGTEFNPEPKRDEVNVQRWGPYTYNILEQSFC